jgi:sugar lactone lactonase YvrE
MTMKPYLSISEPRLIAPVADICGEGALWHPAEQALYWTDINRFLIHRWDYRSQEVVTWQFAEPVTALALTSQDDIILVVLGSRVLVWKPASDDRSHVLFHLPNSPQVRCNDARVDPAGVLWVTTMQNNVAPDGGALPIDNSLGMLFSLDGHGTTRIWREGLGIGNTVCWSPDRRYLYTGDTLANTIYRFDWHPGSTIANQLAWFRGDPRGLPDGSATDRTGHLWNCRYGGSCILRAAPDGSLERAIDMPIRNPTTCTFGGPNEDTLYITSAGHEDDPAELRGGLFAIQTNVQGVPTHKFLTHRPS